MNKLIQFFILSSLVSVHVFAADMGVPVQLKLRSPGGTYPSESGVTVKVSVLSPTTRCVLREEIFSGQVVTNGALSLTLGQGTRGANDPNLALNQVYDNSKAKAGLSCVDAANNVISTAQTYTPAADDIRVLRIQTNVSADPILVDFDQRSVPFALQAESVGGKAAADILVQNTSSELNQSNLNNLLLDASRYNNLVNFAISGSVTNATNFSGALAGDVSGNQGTTSVDKIKGIPVSATAPTNGQVLQFNGTQYVPAALPSAPVTSVAGRTGAVVLSTADISGLGTAATLNAGTAANNVVQLDGSGLIPLALLPNSVLTTSSSTAVDVSNATAAATPSTLVKRDASGNFAAATVSTQNTSTNNIYLYDSTNSIRIKAPTLSGNVVLTLPADAGSGGQVLGTDGAGNLSWVNSTSGSVTAVSASAPLASSGGANPNITISQSSATTNGYLSSSDWSMFNSKQSSLGFTPLNPANNLSDVSNAGTARSNLGLGGAAVLNVGTAAGTVAAGDDSRITGALQASDYNSQVAGASACTSTQTSYYNTVSSQWACQNISFPGSVTLAGDVSGSSSANVVDSVGGQSSGTIAAAVTDVASASSGNGSNTLVKRDASGNISVSNLGSTSVSSNGLNLFSGANSIQLKAPAGLASNLTLNLPGSNGSAGQYLQTDGAGNLSWVTGASSGVSTVTASAPLASSGGSNPNITISQSSASTNGYLSSSDWSTFNSKQSALGFTPLNSANNLSDLANTTTARSNLGLGGSAVLNVGTAAGTVAAGDDSRITGALQASSYNAQVAPAALCTSTQTSYYNSVSSQWACQNISFPVTSVAGKTGAVTLVSSDISGLGTAAVLNVGTSAGDVVQLDGTARIPASTLPTTALTTSSVHSGDVSGTASTMSVDRIKGTPVSATAPTAGQALVYNGSQWVPTTGFPQFAKITADLPAFSSTTVSDATGLSFSVTAGNVYKYRFVILYTSAATNTGLRVGLTYPAVNTASAVANIASGGDGTGAYFQGVINVSGDSVMALNTPSSTTIQIATIDGIIYPSASGTVQLRAATEVALSNIVIKAGSLVEFIQLP